MYTLCVVESLEFEYDEPLLAIINKIIRTEDDNITQRVKPAIGAVSENWKKACNCMKIRLCDGGLFPKRKPIPKAYFDFKNQAKMLDYHNGLDVFTVEELLKWQ